MSETDIRQAGLAATKRVYSTEERIERPVPEDVIKRLSALPQPVRSYEPDGTEPGEFITFDVTQKTLIQFYETGWKLLEDFKM